MKTERVDVNIEKFIAFHKDRITLLNEFEKQKRHGKLIFQICFLGFESLARVLYPKEESSGKRFKNILSKIIDKKEAERLYDYWRNPLIHEGFISNPWTALENEDDAFLSYSEKKMRTSVEHPPGSMVSIYNDATEYLRDFFKKGGVKKVEIRWKKVRS
ncbi:MAG: hypothetical protein Q7R96_03280 [Nanoarchaeota archaeon]|nr:hypothetical protein [Nanoarchaeota archaeon]